jgi:hypothetical protein
MHIGACCADAMHAISADAGKCMLFAGTPWKKKWKAGGP